MCRISSFHRYTILTLIFLDILFLANLNAQVNRENLAIPENAIATESQFLNNPPVFEFNKGQISKNYFFLSRTDDCLIGFGSSLIKIFTNNGRQTTDISFLGSNDQVIPVGIEKVPQKKHYFFGDIKTDWIESVPHFSKLRYNNIYPGIDMIFRYNHAKQLEFDFIVSPFANPDNIKIQFSDRANARLNDNGDLIVSTQFGNLLQHRPLIYQDIAGSRHIVSGKYFIIDNNTVQFLIKDYDKHEPLVIDPVLSYSSFLGGGDGNEKGFDIATDQLGFVYITGRTGSFDFPVVNPAQDTIGGGSDAFVTKITPDGGTIVYSTFLGGSEDEASANGIAVDALGNAYIIGTTTATDYPTTPGAFQENHGGTFIIAFITKLDPNGQLVYSTYLGGTIGTGSGGTGIAVDSNGNVYATGNTSSADFPTTPGAWQTVLNGPRDVYISKLNTFGSNLIYSTFIGGSNFELANDITIDLLNNAVITGFTRSVDFPVTPGVFQPVFGGGVQDIFVSKINPLGTSLVSSTYIGGSDDDNGRSIALDAVGNILITGETKSANYPVLNAFQPNYGLNQDVVVTKLTPDGTALIYSTFLGGNFAQSCRGIAVDDSANAFITGFAGQVPGDFPTTPDALQTVPSGTSDAFLAKLTPLGDLAYSTYFGGSSGELAEGVAIDCSGNAHFTGFTRSLDYPVVNPFQASLAGREEAFVAKIQFRNLRPIANAGLDQTVFAGDSVQLNGSGSSDSDNNPLTYFWQVVTLPFGSNPILDDPTSENPIFIADSSGAYIIELTVNDGQINSTPDSVTITVQTASEAIEDLANSVEVLVNSGVLNQGQGNALSTKLENAISKLEKGNTNAALNQLQAFVNQVNGLINGGVLTTIEGQPLVDVANIVITQIIGGSKRGNNQFQGESVSYSTFMLEQNYPNPFNPETNISFRIDKSSESKVIIYNTLGEIVRVLVKSYLVSGDYTVKWDGKDQDGYDLPSGIYFYKLEVGNISQTKKMNLLK